MTIKNNDTTTPTSFITSRKHARPLPAHTLAMLASLALPAAAHAGGDVTPDPTIPSVQVSGANQPQQASANEKFTAPLLDTPKSVTVVPAEIIAQTGATSLTDALRTVPGITIGAAEGGNPVGDNMFIRGYNAQTDTYVDGIRDAGSQSREIFAVEQIEVVKGPNSALGGRASAGGGVNLITKTAQAYDFNRASIGIGSDKYRRLTGDLNRNIGSDSAFRLNVMAHENDVPGRAVVGGKRYGVAPTVTFGLSGPTRAIIGVYHLTTHEIPDTGIPFNNPITTGPDVAKNGNGRPFDVDRSTFYGLANRDFRDTKSDIANTDLRHQLANGIVLRNVTRYGKSNNDYVWTQPDDSKGNTVLYGTVWRRANTRVTETRTATNVTSISGELQAAGIKHTVNAGIEFDRETTDRSNYVFTPGTNNPLTGTFTCPASGSTTLYNCTTLVDPNPYDPWVYTRTVSPALTHVSTKTKAAYAFDTIEFDPRWQLNLGARYDDFQSVLNTLTTATRAAVNSNFWSLQSGLVVKPAENGSVYLAYATSATPPGNDGGDGLDALTVAVQNLQPQRSRNVELGTKWDVMPGGRLSLTAAVFKSTMNNARVTAPDGTTQNVGRKGVRGAELGFSGKLSSHWSVFGGYTYLDATVADNGYLNVGTTANPVYVVSPYNGNRFPATPKHSATLWTTYAVTKDFSAGFGVNAMSKVYGNVNNNKWAPGYTRVDAMASYALNQDVSLQLNVQNLTDKFYFDRVSSPHYAGVGPGRSATLAANVKF